MTHGIEWLNRPGTTGETWSPVTGCTPISEGCAHCYARRMARRLAGRFGYPEAPREFDVTLHPDRLDEPYRWRKPRTVFVVSMGDLFHPGVPFEYIDKVWHCMGRAREHTFIVLTKRPRVMFDWMEWHDEATELYVMQRRLIMRDPLPNIWLGITAENQRRANERIPWLVGTPAAVHFVSFEPLLSRIFVDARQANLLAGIQWAIVGAETGPGARPMDLGWARDLRDQCAAAGVPFFWKRAGPGQTTPPDLAAVRQWPERLRQGKHR